MTRAFVKSGLPTGPGPDEASGHRARPDADSWPQARGQGADVGIAAGQDDADPAAAQRRRALEHTRRPQCPGGLDHQLHALPEFLQF